jgi:hypothetical protein
LARGALRSTPLGVRVTPLDDGTSGGAPS